MIGPEWRVKGDDATPAFGRSASNISVLDNLLAGTFSRNLSSFMRCS
jgi:hypothetical protein